MSYRLITNATFAVTSASGEKTERNVEVRLYPAPKRDASGLITVDGSEVSYKRTGGRGRGTTDNRYVYATVKALSGFFLITEAESSALVGGKAELNSLPTGAEATAKEVEPAKAEEVAKAEEAAPETAKGADEAASEEAASPEPATETASEPASEPVKRRAGKKVEAEAKAE